MSHSPTSDSSWEAVEFDEETGKPKSQGDAPGSSKDLLDPAEGPSIRKHEKSEQDLGDEKAGSFLKPKYPKGRVSNDEKSVQTDISWSPSSSLQPSPFPAPSNPLTPQPKQPVKLVPMFRVGNGSFVHFQGCHHLRRKDIKSVTKIFACANCAHTIYGREQVFLLPRILNEIHSSECEFSQHTTASLRICTQCS